VPVLRLSAGEIAQLRLDAAEKYLLSRCDGKRDLAQIAQVAPLEEVDVLKAFRRFVEAGTVELRAG
jgi:aminopeptidase-like protein